MRRHVTQYLYRKPTFPAFEVCRVHRRAWGRQCGCTKKREEKQARDERDRRDDAAFAAKESEERMRNAPRIPQKQRHSAPPPARIQTVSDETRRRPLGRS